MKDPIWYSMTPEAVMPQLHGTRDELTTVSCEICILMSDVTGGDPYA